MIRQLLYLGRAIGKGASPAQALEMSVERAQGTLYLLDLDPGKKLARLTPSLLDEEKRRRFLWVGDPPQSNKARDRVTTKELRYLVAEIPTNLLQHEKLGSRLAGVTRKVGEGRYAHVLDLEGYWLEGGKDVPRKGQDPFWVQGGRLHWDLKGAAFTKELAEALAQVLEEAWGLGKGERLFSLALGGKPVAEWPKYRDHLYHILFEEPFSEAPVGICYGCGQKDRVISHSSNLRYKFYITDKLGFASDLEEGGFRHSLALCRECYQALLLGETYAQNHLEASFLGEKVLVLPEAFGQDIDPWVLVNWKKYLLDEKRGLEEILSWRDFLQRAGIPRGIGFSLIFFQRLQSATKATQVILEVPPSQVEALLRAMGENYPQEDRRGFRPWEWGDREGNLKDWLFLLEGTERETLLQVVSHLFQGLPLERGFLLPSLLRGARAVLLKDHRKALARLALGGGWVWVLVRLGVLKLGGERMVRAADVPEEYREVFAAYGFDEFQAGLYLLGVALETVGHAQAKDREYQDEPLLRTINWEGMSLPQVRHLVLGATERGKHYLVGSELSRYLETLGLAQYFLHRGKASLSDREVPYFILMGYAQARKRRLAGGSKTKAEEAEAEAKVEEKVQQGTIDGGKEA